MRSFIFFTVIVLLCGCQEHILHDLAESDANRLLTRLYEAGVRGEKEKQADGQWSISVPEHNAPEALRLLSDARVFRRAQRAGKKGSSMLSSREEQRFRFERALSQEIEATLISLDGVLEARVHMNIPPSDPLFGKRKPHKPGSGSVLMVVAADFKPAEEELARLVSGASGIAEESISVLITRSHKGQFMGDSLGRESPTELRTRSLTVVSPLKRFGWQMSALIGGFLVVALPILLRRKDRWNRSGAKTTRKMEPFQSLYRRVDSKGDSEGEDARTSD